MNECVLTLPKFHHKQQVAFDSAASEILFAGDTRAGKSFFIRKAYIIYASQIPGLMLDIFRLHFDDVIKENMEGETSFPVLLNNWEKAGLCKINQTEITFWNESKILLEHCFTADTKIQTTEGVLPISSLVGRNGSVFIAKGVPSSFVRARKTRESAPIVKVQFEDGETYRCTPDHKFITSKGPVEARNLLGCLCLTNESELSAIQSRYLMDAGTHCKASTLAADQQGFIEWCGNTITGKFREALKSIIRTKTEAIIRLRTWNLCSGLHTDLYTQAHKRQKSVGEKTLERLNKLPVFGTPVQRARSGIKNKSLRSRIAELTKSASTAAKSLLAFQTTPFALAIAGTLNIEKRSDIISSNYARFAVRNLKQSPRGQQRLVELNAGILSKQKRCVSVTADGEEDVYCLTVPEYGFFPLSNGVLVFNCSDDTVMMKHRGIARHVRTFSESTQILEHRIRALTGWVTMSEEMKSRVPERWKGQFPKVFHITNPHGPSAGYYRREFVDSRPPYQIAKVGQFQRQYIPAFLDDNPSEDQESTRARIAEAFPDKEMQKALINEDKSGVSNWHCGAGEFFPEWDRRRHVVASFTPPSHWYRYRSMDIGWAEPAAIYYIAVSDGEPFRDEEDRERWFPRGARIFYNEWYLCLAERPAKGLGMRNEDIAAGILERSEFEHRKVHTLTDSKPFQGMGGEHPALTFQKCGVTLTQVDTGPGSRVAGWSIMRSALVGSPFDTQEGIIRIPMVYFCDNCNYAIDYIPALPRHPSQGKKEDAAEHGEATHACDAVRYGLVGHPIIKDRLEPMPSRIEKELRSHRPTVKKITRGMGSAYF